MKTCTNMFCMLFIRLSFQTPHPFSACHPFDLFFRHPLSECPNCSYMLRAIYFWPSFFHDGVALATVVPETGTPPLKLHKSLVNNNLGHFFFFASFHSENLFTPCNLCTIVRHLDESSASRYYFSPNFSAPPPPRRRFLEELTSSRGVYFYPIFFFNPIQLLGPWKIWQLHSCDTHLASPSKDPPPVFVGVNLT